MTLIGTNVLSSSAIRESSARPLISGSEAIMPRQFCLVKHFVVLFWMHYIFRLMGLVGQFQACGCWEGEVTVDTGWSRVCSVM
ncbi:MAG: hypothetical protein EOP13_02855 [Pseudomonas sp.]|nr:MAG: hypothetical protein EOP13_02855 [Pseudomonas sp.]